MDKGISNPTALKSTVTKATDSSPGGRRTRGLRKKAVASDGPVLPATSTQIESKLKPPKSTKRSAWLTKGSGRPLKTIESIQLETTTTPVSSSAGFELLCTYNWGWTSSPTIYVPGGPPRWKPPTLPITLPKDSGTRFVDQNAFQGSAYPFEPMFAALDLMKPEFGFGGVDLVANRNSLRKLLDFASGRVRDSFRIDVNLVENTLFLTRRERSARDVIRGSRHTGYGHNFENASTEPQKGLEDSSAHHRVVMYRMGELNCVVRFEVDAWCGGEVEGEGRDERASGFEGAGGLETGAVQRNGDVLTDFMKLSLGEGPSSKTSDYNQEIETGQEPEDMLRKQEHLSVDESKGRKKPAQYKPTRVIPRGCLVPCSTLAEIKTKKKKARLAETLPQLWFGRTPLLLHATHDEGTFAKQVEKINAREKFQGWEKQQQEVLRKMVRLIGQLRDIASEEKGGACIVVCENKVRPLKLEIFENTARKRVLPEEIVERYWRERTIPSGS